MQIFNNLAVRGGQIAIVIPVYNANKYISECIDLLIGQTYPNWVAYCVDDGSTDNSLDILKAYSAKDSRIKVFSKPNGGASSARNYALDNLENEEWVSFVDADDYVLPDMYSSIIAALSANNNVEYVRLFNRSTPLRYHTFIDDDKTNIDIDAKIVNTSDYFLYESVGGFTHSLFVKAGIIQDNKIRFPENMRVLEDQVFSITCATKCRNIMVLSSPRNYCYFSANFNSITKTTKDTRADDVRCINKVYEAFMALNSKRVLTDYFYKKYLPMKLTSISFQCLRYRSKNKEIINPDIKISSKYMDKRSKIFYCIADILQLI